MGVGKLSSQRAEPPSLLEKSNSFLHILCIEIAKFKNWLKNTCLKKQLKSFIIHIYVHKSPKELVH